MSAPNADMEAAIKFQRPKQTGSARDYSIEFVNLSSRLTRDTYFASLFFISLRDDIQDALYHDGALPTTLEDMTKKAVVVDNFLHEKRKRYGPFTHAESKVT
jgi:hypothetical protein